MKEEMTIKEAIESGLISKRELTKVGTRAKQEKITELIKIGKVDSVRAMLSDEINNISRNYGYSSLTIRLYDSANLHEARKILRKSFGKWNDEIYNTFVSGSELFVSYKDKDMNLACQVYIECYYPLDNLPKGLLKPTCKIVEKTEYTIKCEI